MRWLWALAVGFTLWTFIPGNARADTRVALVIGNGAYIHAPHLANPPHDAEDVAAALKRTGFDTIVGTDLDQAGIQNAAIRFARAARTADVAVFYYSGHALQYAGVNYLVPVDAELRDEADLRRMARVDEILADLQQAKNLRILVLDSCRDNPLADELKRSIGSTRAMSIGRGLARMESPDGTIISYSTQAGRTAEDGSDRHSPYTTAFLQHIEDKEDIATVFHRVGATVYQTTQGKQVPELSLSFFGEFYLNGPVTVTVNPPAQPAIADGCAAAETHWKGANEIGTVAAYQDHLTRFPGCAFADLAKARIESLKDKVAVVAPPSVPPMAQPIAQPLAPGFCGGAATVIGKWAWFNRDTVEIRPDGSLGGNGTGGLGKWSCDNGAVVLVWNSGWVDRLALTSDGTLLSGVNQAGSRVSGFLIDAIAGSQGAPKADPGRCAAIVGKWAWFQDGVVDIKSDGTMRAPSVRTDGKWYCRDNIVVLIWKAGWVDRLTLQSDGTRLSGANQTGTAVSGVLISR